MSYVRLLLSPRWKKFRNRLRKPGQEKLRLPFIIALVLGLWVLVYLAFVKALYYFTAEEMFGTIAAVKLLSMIIMTFGFVVIISNVIAVFSVFYLAEDLELILASPAPSYTVFISRFMENLGDSSWMVLLFGFPIFMAYGKVFSAPILFYILSFFGFLLLLISITAFSIILVEFLVNIFPVRRLRDLFLFIGILIFIGLYLLFRMMRPEEFLNPEGFASMMDYLSIMSESSSPWLPTTWLIQTIKPFITGYGQQDIVFHFALLTLTSISLFRIAGHYHEYVHFSGYSRAMESRGAKLSKSKFIAALNRILESALSRQTAALVIKETLLMARDWGRLSQLLLLLALILVYLYNFSVLPTLDSPEAGFFLKNFIAFLNIGLAGFVLSSLGVRFLFPAVSSEGRAFWVLKGSPVSLRRVLWIKYFFYLFPMLFLGLFLVIATNRLLGLGFAISAVSTITIFLLTLGITSLSIGMGVLHEDFKESDPNKVFTGFGGLLTMIYAALAVAAVIACETFPVYRIVMADYMGTGLMKSDYLIIVFGFLAAAVIMSFLIIEPMRIGLKRIGKLKI